MQKMFLRVLQEHRFRPVGGRTEITSDFRLIAATNRDLEDMAERSTFRSDLLYRMRTVVVSIPPLRERCEDVTALAGHYLPRIWARFALPEKDISPDFHETLLAYHWPGNVRELIHTLERAVLASQDAPKLFARHLPDYLRICLARAAARNGAAATGGLAGLAGPAGQAGLGGPSCLYGAGQAPAGKAATDTTGTTEPDTANPDMAGSDLTRHATDGAQRPLGSLRETPRMSGSELAAQTSHTAQTTRTGRAAGTGAKGGTGGPGASPGWGPRAPYAIYTSPHYAPPPERAAAPHANTDGGDDAARAAYPRHGTDGGMSDAHQAAQPRSFPGALPRFFDFRDAQFATYLRELMRRAGGDIRAACALSGLSRSHLYDLLRKHGVSPR